MLKNKLIKKQNANIEASIHTYQKQLMEDINLILRVTSNQKTYITKPIEWVDKLLVFEAPLSQLEWVQYPQGTVIEMIFVSKLALFHTEVCIEKSYRKANSLYYVGEIIAPLIKKQQREYFRLDVTFDTKFQVLQDDDESHLSLPYEKGIVVNISTGGICLNTTALLKKDQMLCLEFSFADNAFVLLGKVLNPGEKNEAGFYSYRVQFMGLDSADSNLLNRLIFEKQRLLLKKSN